MLPVEASMKISLSKVRGHLDAAIKHVRETDTALLLLNSRGEPVATLKPPPKPVEYWKGRAVYRPEDWDDLGVPKE